MLDFFAILISLCALFGYINHRWLRLPVTIGVMLISVAVGIALKIAGSVHPGSVLPLRNFLAGFDFSSFVLDFILCFLLFAGSLHVNINQLKGARATVFFYSTVGVLVSTVLIGSATYFLTSQVFGFAVFPVHCFLFGALISPTDPIAVIGILSKYNIPQKLKTEIIGESLFNDGVGVVVFTVIFLLASGNTADLNAFKIMGVFGTEVIGGLAIGFVTGYVGYLLMKSIDHYQTEIMITLAIVTGGYSMAALIHASGPLAMVVAGLLIGNKGKDAMSDLSEEYVSKFWEVIDEICNTILFMLMGLEIFLVPYDAVYLLIGAILIVVSLVARYISLVPAFFLFKRKEPRKRLNLAVLTWGGLRGGISIALALSLNNQVRESSLFIVCTYCIVLFSVIVQGLSIQRLLAKY